MKYLIPAWVAFLVVALFASIGFSVWKTSHAPYIEVTNGQIAFHRVYGHKLDEQTFVVPCQIGDFFRVAANSKTVITTFAPTSNGWAIIHFEYLK